MLLTRDPLKLGTENQTADEQRPCHTENPLEVRQRSGRLFLSCLSLANLWFINLWAEMRNPPTLFYRSANPDWPELTALVLDIVLLAVIFWLPGHAALRTRHRKLARTLGWCSLAALVVPLNILRLNFPL